MPMRKGYCIHCNKNDESRRIFDVNSDTKYCYCPHCGKKYRPKIAIFNYERIIHKYNRKAYFYLKNAGEPQLAYNLFAYVLELDSTDKTAKLGRLISLCYLSNLRRNRFLEVKEMLTISREDFHGSRIRNEYAAFLISLSHAVDDFLTRTRRKLTFRDYFYDAQCANLYFKHLADGLDLKRLVCEELSVIEMEKQSSHIHDSIKEIEDIYQKSFYTVDGQEHRLVSFAKSGEPLIVNGKNKENTTRFERYRMCSLDAENKKTRYIKDPVYSLAAHHMYRFLRISFTFFILLLLFGIALTVLYIIFMKQAHSLLLLIFAITFATCALIFFLLRIVFSLKIKKPRL